jgi:hypothetical protein
MGVRQIKEVNEPQKNFMVVSCGFILMVDLTLTSYTARNQTASDVMAGQNLAFLQKKTREQ